VTPFLSLAEAMAAEPDGRPDATFVVGVRPEQAFYLDRLRACEGACSGLEVILWNGQELGHPTAAGLAERIPDLTDRVVMVSGSETMIAELTTGLHQLGVHRERIHSEVAIGPPRQWRHASPALRVLRRVVTVELVVFVGAAIASSIGHG
jgi:ferredoxin-NADP reductase